MKSSKREVLVRRSVHCGDEHCLRCKWLRNGKCSLFVTKTGRLRRLSCDSKLRTLRLDECKEAEAMESDVFRRALARAVKSRQLFERLLSKSTLHSAEPARTKPVRGTCCSCSYAGSDETTCQQRRDRTHCVHWWDGPDSGQDAGWREHFGRVLRDAWLGWARQQPDPKPSWLLPWEDLPAEHQEVDMLMAEAVLASVLELRELPSELARAVMAISDAVIVRVLQPRSPSSELAEAEERLRGGPGALEMEHTEIIAAELDRLRGEVARLLRSSGKTADEP